MNRWHAEVDEPLVQWPNGDLLYSSRVRRWRPSERTRVVAGYLIAFAFIALLLVGLSGLEAVIGS